VIENLTFRLAAGTDDAAFRALDARVQQEIAYHQAGLVRRTTARSDDGEWLVSTIWQSAAHADAATAVREALLPLIDPATVRSTRYVELD
jgi:hypothetical protein